MKIVLLSLLVVFTQAEIDFGEQLEITNEVNNKQQEWRDAGIAEPEIETKT